MKNEALQVSQSSIAQALAADYFCIYYVNVQNDRFTEYSASPEYEELGLPTEGDDFLSFTREQFPKIVYEEDRERFLNTFTKENVITALETNATFTMTFQLLFRSGPTYVHLKATRMIEEDRQHAVVGISNIDEQMKAMEAFEEAHNASITYSLIAQALAENYFSIYHVDLDTGHFIEYSSDAAYKQLGIEKSGDDFFSTTRNNIRRVVYREDQGAFLKAFTKENIRRALKDQKTFTLNYRLIMDSVPTWVRMKITRMKDGGDNQIIIGVSNIDAQIQQQNEYLRAERDRIAYSRVAQALAADYFSIYVVDPDTDHFTEYSATEMYDELGVEKSGEDFFNLSRANMERLIYPEDRDRFMEIFKKERILAITERDGHFTTKYRLMFGETPVWVSMKATLLNDDEGRRLIIGTNNIDAQIRREDEFKTRMAEARTSAKNDFLANMSHDIRTPMNAIVGYTNIAKSNIDDRNAVNDALEKIGSSSHFLLSLINDILDISKIESGKMQLSMGPCDLTDIFRRIEDITLLQAQKKNLRVSYQHDSVRRVHVYADELRIEQVLINIISNAIKYTPDGKTVDLIAEELGTTDDGRIRYRFIIRDTGIGISEDYLPHIFESFTREQNTKLNRVQGTGLGLAITGRIVELMDGTISVKSKVGEGSEFTVDIALEPLEAEMHEETQQAAPSDLSGRHILLVEDNDINAEIAVMILEQYGLTADRAQNGRIGADMVKSKGTDYYDAVLMDIQMPVMNGYEATREIRAMETGSGKELPIIAMSANAYDEDVRECLAAGMNAHIAKPFDPEDLIRLLNRYIH